MSEIGFDIILIFNCLQAILQCGVEQRDLVLVALWADERALVRILGAFPGLRVVTSRILAQDDSMSDELCQLLHSRLLLNT